MGRFADRLAAIAFVVSLALVAMIYGIVSSWWGWFPAPQIGLAHRTFVDLSENWQNDLGLEPTRHLVRSADTDPDRGFRIADGARPVPGYVLVSGLSDDQETSTHVVRMFDETGVEIHRWPIHYDRLDEVAEPRNVMLHGMEVFEDGSLAVTFDVGNAIARIDACGIPIWSVNGNFHHSIARDGEGQIVTWRGEEIVHLDEETGEERAVLDLRDMVMAGGGEQRAYFDLRTVTLEESGDRITYVTDPFHPNDAEPLRADMADAFPMFEAGDILFSLREINLVAVADPETGWLKWWHHGPWSKQHDPDFQPDGTITVYDNSPGTGHSSIRRIDPSDDTLSSVFRPSDTVPFFSWRRGKHQILENGNVLLTEAERGRVLEVDPEGALVWERNLPWDAQDNLIVTEARHVDPDFFGDETPRCDAPEP